MELIDEAERAVARELPWEKKKVIASRAMERITMVTTSSIMVMPLLFRCLAAPCIGLIITVACIGEARC